MKSNKYRYCKIFLALLVTYPGIFILAFFVTDNLKYKRLFNVTFFHSLGIWHPLLLPIFYFAINFFIKKKNALALLCNIYH